MLYPCVQCQYIATKSNHFKSNVQSKREGVKFPCDTCDYIAGDPDTLKRHNSIKHVEVRLRFACNQCEYSAIAPQLLKVHLESIHEKVCYLCNLCENTFTTKEHMKRHTKNKHQGIYISRAKLKIITNLLRVNIFCIRCFDIERSFLNKIYYCSIKNLIIFLKELFYYVFVVNHKFYSFQQIPVK